MCLKVMTCFALHSKLSIADLLLFIVDVLLNPERNLEQDFMFKDQIFVVYR